MHATRRLYQDVDIALGDQDFRIPAMLFGAAKGLEYIRTITINKAEDYNDDRAQAYVAFILEAIPARQLRDFTWAVVGYALALRNEGLLLSKQTQVEYIRRNCSTPDFNTILDQRPLILSKFTCIDHVHIDIEKLEDIPICRRLIKSTKNLKKLTMNVTLEISGGLLTSQTLMPLLFGCSSDEDAIFLPLLEQLDLNELDLFQALPILTKLVDFRALTYLSFWNCDQIDGMLDTISHIFMSQHSSVTPKLPVLSAICNRSPKQPRLRELWISRDQHSERRKQLKSIDELLLSFSGLKFLYIILRYLPDEFSGERINHSAIINHRNSLQRLCIGIKSDIAIETNVRPTGISFSNEEFSHLCHKCRHLQHLSLPLCSIDNEDHHEFPKLLDKIVVSFNIPGSVFRVTLHVSCIVDFALRKVSSSCLG